MTMHFRLVHLTATVLGMAALSLSSACLACAQAPSGPPGVAAALPPLTYHHGADAQVTVLKTLENSHLAVKIYSNSAIEIEDRVNGRNWKTGPVAIQDKTVVEVGQVWLTTTRDQTLQYPGRFFGRLEGDNISFELLGRQDRLVGRFLCHVALDGAWLVFRILEVDDSIPSLAYPPPLQSDAIVLPKGAGEILREPERGNNFSRQIYPFFTRLNMRWLGGMRGDAAWIGIFDDGFEDAAALVANRTATPIFMRSLNRWSHPYSYRLRFVKGDYVDLAKIYRQWIIDRGEFVSLAQKMKANPDLQSFLGGRAFWINLAFPNRSVRSQEDLLMSEAPERGGQPGAVRVVFTYKELSATIERLKALGLTRGFVKIGGWINGGYDYSHQDVWPPEPALGSVAELQQLLASPAPLLVGLHDNNQDIYPHTPSFPKGVIRNADGDLLTGGVWAGGQAYILNSRYSVDYARRNWEQIKTLHPKAMFIDIVTAMQLYQSFEPGDELTKAQDLAAKKQLLAFYKQQGVLLGSEESADFAIPYLDWFENRHQRVAGRTVPLWSLVFHDAVFNTRYGGVTRDVGYPGWLEDMLWGYLPHFSIDRDWKQDKLFQSMDHVDQWHARIGMAEMTSHKFLTADYSVEQTTFSTGDSIICNFGDKPYDHHGKAVSPKSYLIVN
jgi:hypothetical protein